MAGDTEKQRGGGMKLLIIGAGGIGSFFLKELCLAIKQNQVDPYTQVTIADDDVVQSEQVLYQDFKIGEAGLRKVDVLGERYKSLGVNGIPARINAPEQLTGHDLIVLCVDNDRTRDMVVRYCHKHQAEFLDLRSSGRRILAMPKLSGIEENLKFIDADDTKSHSCQEVGDLQQGYIQKGHKIVALIGIQMLLNHIRGHPNRMVSLLI